MVLRTLSRVRLKTKLKLQERNTITTDQNELCGTNLVIEKQRDKLLQVRDEQATKNEA